MFDSDPTIKTEFLDFPKCSNCETYRKRVDEVFKQLEFLEGLVANCTDTSEQKCEALGRDVAGIRKTQDADKKGTDVALGLLRGEVESNTRTLESFKGRLEAAHRLHQDHSCEAKGNSVLGLIENLEVTHTFFFSSQGMKDFDHDQITSVKCLISNTKSETRDLLRQCKGETIHNAAPDP